jgi:hypothetical protein
MSANMKNTNTNTNTNNTNINTNTLCIPRVFPNIRESRIRGVFNALQLGEIEKIDMITMDKNGENYNRVYIKYSKWFDNENVKNVHKRIQEGKDFKVIYDDPWFWKVFAHNKKEPNRTTTNQNQQFKTKPKPKKAYIVIDSNDNVSSEEEKKSPSSPDHPPPKTKILSLINPMDILEEEYNLSKSTASSEEK